MLGLIHAFMQKHYYAYIRVSTVKQGEKGSSLQEQRAAIENYAHRFGLVIGEWFEEQVTAAKRGRPQFNRLMSLLQRGKGHGVIIHKIDRSARNLKDWADIGELIDAGIEIHFAHEALDLQSRGGRLAADIQAVVASDFIRNLRDEVRKGIRGRLKQGLFPGRAPIGYLDCGKGLPKIPDLLRAPLIQRAFELCATGDYNLVMLQQELYRMGLRNSSGGKVSHTGLSIILRNPFYYGLIYIKRTGESFAGIHEPLISKSLFDDVQACINGRKKHSGLKRKYLCQKTLRCYECKSILIPEMQKGWIYYRCHSGVCATKCIREELITSQLFAYLNAFNVPLDVFKKLEFVVSEKASNAASLEDQERKHLQLARAASDERLRVLTDAYLDEAIDRDTFERRKHDLLAGKLVTEEKLKSVDTLGSSKVRAAREYIELLKRLNDKAVHEIPAHAVLMAKRITSNFFVFRKRLVPEWNLPSAMAAPDAEPACGAPYRDTSRTFDGDELIEWAESIEAEPWW